MNYVPLEPPAASGKVKSVFCFVITPAWKRTGIATSLLTQVCQDAAQEGFDFVEAYPYQASGYQSSDFGGYVQMYLHNGFQITVDTDQGLVVRKSLH
ncbi:hypothetical protein SDC9_212000 [bioreactor metagenome]|uniref:N-acetyltransferase domain-containing protein n=1 Tax=bioreactor metagenome TaxID=1076179 RepID=A0A645JN96_9ZZZZ